MLTLAALTLGFQLAGWMIGILVVLFVLVSVILMLTILIQKPQGGGLSAAFGEGAGSGQTAFGTKTGDALTIATISMFAIWIFFGVGLNYALTPHAAPPAGAAVNGDGDAPANSTDGANTSGGKNSGTEQKPAEKKPADQKPADQKPAEGTPAKPGEQKPAEQPKDAPASPAPADKPAPAPADKPAGEKPAGEPTGKP